MKIAILGRFRKASSNGVDRTIEGHIRHFSAAGHKITLITTEELDSEEADELHRLGVTVIRIPALSPFAFIKLRALESRNFDVLWLHSVFTPRNWLAFLSLGCPWVTTPNGGYSPGQIAYKRPYIKALALKLVERRMLEKALFVQVLSENERDQTLSVAPSATCVIAPNGCEPPNDLSRDRVPGPIRFLFIGRLAWMHKGLDRFLKALKQLDSSYEWQFDIVGPGNPSDIGYLKEICTDSPIENRVVFHGPLYGSVKDSLVNRCNVFVHTSRWEGMPFSVIEILGQGIPVLVTPGTNMADMIQRHDAGWVAEDNDIAAAVNEILAADPVVLASKGQNALKLVRTELDWKKISGILLNKAETLLANAR